jgi:hypothetical protein
VLLSEWLGIVVSIRKRETRESSHHAFQTTGSQKNKLSRCMMKASESVHTENVELLMEIVNLKTKINEMYDQTGPNTSEYITLSIRLNFLIDKYFAEKSQYLVSI